MFITVVWVLFVMIVLRLRCTWLKVLRVVVLGFGVNFDVWCYYVSYLRGMVCFCVIFVVCFVDFYCGYACFKFLICGFDLFGVVVNWCWDVGG